ncbi:hypothetical protein HU200_008331 [Digitaria exilis]|uniref:Uncharacterized protein n=1 Tax=Digitaria exilis TaxID=1010633 RepID=A0A835FNA9_9POAL|nr:hypothetical protein HU200_008331 [Digitaria exilis]
MWQLMGVVNHPGMHQQPWFLGKEFMLLPHVHLDVILLVLHQIRKASNTLIFDSRTRNTSIKFCLGDSTCMQVCDFCIDSCSFQRMKM